MIGSLMMRVSVVILLVGMLGRNRDGHPAEFVLAPAHAHLNLVGGVLLFLFGLYYRLIPAAGGSALAKCRAGCTSSGAILFPVGVAVVMLKGSGFQSLADRGLADRGRGDGAVRGDRVPDLAGLSLVPYLE